MGGGTFDLSLLAVRRGLYEVLATGGDPFLGGDDMDHALTDELARRFLAQHRIDPRTNSHSMAKMMVAAEQIKIKLSDTDEFVVHIPDLDRGLDGMPLNLDTTVTKAQFQELIEPIVARALECAEAVLAEADVLPEHVDEVLLVGGATLVPLVRQGVEALFGRVTHASVDPMEVVALGAAAHAQALFAPESIGRRRKNPDEDALDIEDDDDNSPTGEYPQIALLLDVTSHPVGLATAGGFAEVLLPKNTQIPAEVVRFFSTAKDNQESVVLKVCQGADPRFDQNEALGQLTLEGLRPGPRGQVRIEVGFLIDADGLLQVTARDQDTGAQTQAVLSLFGLGDYDDDDDDDEILEIED
jgi:molecular chaperone DnaK